MSRSWRTGLLWLALAVGLAAVSCAGSAALDPARIHGDAEADAAYARWHQEGEPRVPAAVAKKHTLEGKASWYGPGFQGRQTANGEAYDMYGFTAAHRSLPFGSLVRVWRPDTRQQVVVRINDRGPYVDGRVIDLSYGAAYVLGLVEPGVLRVELELLTTGR